jgi:hypothetical protein
MIKILSLFVIFTMAFAIGIDLFNKMRGNGMPHYLETLGYSATLSATTLLVFATLAAIF